LSGGGLHGSLTGMEIPTPALASPSLLALGSYLLSALRFTPDTAPLVDSFQPTHAALAAAAGVTRAAEEALVPARVAVVFAERQLEVAIRAVGFSAQTADGGRGGKIFTALFPRGLTAELRPRAQAQLDAALALARRLEAQSTAAPVRAERGAMFAAAVEAMDKALADRREASDALGTARAREMAVREDYTRAYDSIAGELKVVFPRDRAQQNLYFDAVRSRPSREDDVEEPADPQAEPQA
jgi:hypothetical protein